MKAYSFLPHILLCFLLYWPYRSVLQQLAKVIVGEEEERGEREGERNQIMTVERRGEILESPGWHHHLYLRDVCNLGI